MLAIDVADARGRSLAIAAVMSLSKFFVAGCAQCSVGSQSGQFTYQALIFDFPGWLVSPGACRRRLIIHAIKARCLIQVRHP